jgi:hypothetical protein
MRWEIEVHINSQIGDRPIRYNVEGGSYQIRFPNGRFSKRLTWAEQKTSANALGCQMNVSREERCRKS